MQEEVKDGKDSASFQTLKQILSLPMFDILDECDELLSSRHQLVYAWGSQEDLPDLSERVQVIQTVLHTLCKDASVGRVLQDGTCSIFREHERRYSGAPEVQLLGGAAPPQSQLNPCNSTLVSIQSP